MERTASGKEIVSRTKSGLNILKDSDCVGNDYETIPEVFTIIAYNVKTSHNGKEFTEKKFFKSTINEAIRKADFYALSFENQNKVYVTLSKSKETPFRVIIGNKKWIEENSINTFLNSQIQ